ncbi:L-lysine 6-transaminase [Mucilaginibacter lacusdianchii]|uniref:L-lysine 6-transaminase n=1 Tax=Mucilaginibacter lacusdianchii TaxID=2684211 RepID=UPI00131EBF2A|nr:L-lysine 6-transaminase [Mucilaginibacter sp. JXJ CY 39]
MNTLPIKPENVQSVLQKHLIADGFDLTFDMEKSKGVYIYDSKHNRTLLDFFTCFASVPLGYNHPALLEDEDFKKDLLLAALTNPSNSDIYTTQYARFVQTFSRVGIPHYLPHAFFVAGGGPAIENALKTAMDWKVQKNFAKGYTYEKGFKVLHFEHAFHGRLGYTLSLTNTLPVKTKWFAKFDWPRVSHPSVRFPLTDENMDDLLRREAESITQIKQAFVDNKDDICAIIIEPVQAEGGDNHVRTEFMEQLRLLADENEAMLIYDEVQTGVSLSGKFWCYEHFGEKAQPDIVAFGKKMQVCGILASKRVDENEQNVFNVSSRINSTWGGSLVDMVRITKILEVIEQEDLCNHAARTGQYLQSELLKLAAEHPIICNIRGKGLLTAFDFPDKAIRDAFINKGLAHNTMFLGCAQKTIRFRPALTMQAKHIDEGISIMKKILQTI